MTANVYDTTNLDPSQFQAMATVLAKDMTNPASPGFSVVGPQGEQLMNAAMAINNTQNAATGTLAQIPTIGSQVSASTTGAAVSSNPGLASNIVGTINPDGTFTQNPNNPLQQAQVGGQAAVNSAVNNAVSNIASPVTNWISGHAGNYGLVIMGGLLVLGALLISQRKNIETVVTTGAKVAAL